jgi:hypothetical protein
VALEVLEHVEERGRGRRLVAVHLRPQQNAERTGAGGEHVDRSSLAGGADALEDEPRRIRLRDRLEPPLDLVVFQKRRQRGRHMLGVPDAREILRRDGRGLGLLAVRQRTRRKKDDERRRDQRSEHARHYLRE